MDNKLREILDKLDFKLKPLTVGGIKHADEIVITGKDQALSAIKDLMIEERIDELKDMPLMGQSSISCTVIGYAKEQYILDRIAELRSLIKGSEK
jgi:hypothetical protein